jgi:hypothetical protein
MLLSSRISPWPFADGECADGKGRARRSLYASRAKSNTEAAAACLLQAFAVKQRLT